MKTAIPRPKSPEWAVDWPKVARLLRDNPGVEVLLDECGFEDTPRLRALRNTVEQGGVAALVELGGVVFAAERNSRSIGGSRRRGDLWLRWEPEADPHEHYAQRFLERGVRAGRITPKEVAS